MSGIDVGKFGTAMKIQAELVHDFDPVVCEEGDLVIVRCCPYGEMSTMRFASKRCNAARTPSDVTTAGFPVAS